MLMASRLLILTLHAKLMQDVLLWKPQAKVVWPAELLVCGCYAYCSGPNETEGPRILAAKLDSWEMDAVGR